MEKRKKSLRFYLALWTSKTMAFLMRLMKRNATHMPGKLALKICPDFLKRVTLPPYIIAVSGTNGKTTVVNLIADALEKSGKKVLSNRMGGNIKEGITVALIDGITPFCKSKYDLAVLEMDERSSRLVLPYVQPDIYVCTNLFRDSMKRNAHSEFIKGILESAIPKKSKLVLNADDMISSRLAQDNERFYFSVAQLEGENGDYDNIVNDMRICPVCDAVLSYDFHRYHHIGKVHCDNCGFKSPAGDLTALSADFKNGVASFELMGERFDCKIAGNNMLALYNTVAAAAALHCYGMDIKQIKDCFESAKIVKSRYDEFEVGGVKVVLNLSKGQNSVACSRTFDYIRNYEGDKAVVIIYDDYFDALTSSENISWFYDTDYELLNHESIKQVVVGGKRHQDNKVRLLLAGVDSDKIATTEKEADTPKLVDTKKVSIIFVIYDVYSTKALNDVTNGLKEILGGADK